MSIVTVTAFTGNANVPQDVKRRRHQVYDVMRRLGTPVLIKHMFNIDDVAAGIASASPSFDDVYGQPRNKDPLSYGVGFVSTETSINEWIKPDGTGIVTAATSPGQGYVIAPKYRGFGPGYLTYVIMPDTAEDIFKLIQTGALIKTQNATAQAPWYPAMNDNDLLIAVELDSQNKIVNTLERYQLKMATPTSIRGLDRRGRREYTEHGGNRFVINQSFQLNLVPKNSILHDVETDR